MSTAAAPSDDLSTLRAVTLLVRHGIISPKEPLPGLNTDWPMGHAQLTALGIRQMYLRGVSLRERYVDGAGLIDGRYQRSEVYVRASNTDRSLQSAQMLMLGLFPLGTGPDPAMYHPDLEAVPSPELAFDPVPIHSVALENDSVLRPWTRQADCRAYREWVKELADTPAYREMGAEHADYLRRMADVAGILPNATAPEILFAINDITEPVSANLSHGLPVPEEFSAEDVQLLRDLGDWNYYHRFHGPEVGRLTGGAFVGEIVRNFEAFTVDPAHARRFSLYAGHQRGMLGLDAALDVETARTEGELHRGKVPDLASYYAFELHEIDDQYVVMMKYITDDGMQLIPLPGCEAEHCPLETFVEAVRGVIPTDWEAECLQPLHASRHARPPGDARVVINEVRSTEDDAIEIVNLGDESVTLAGWTVIDNDPSHEPYVFPDPSALAPSGMLVLQKGVHHRFGLGSLDRVSLYSPQGSLVDHVEWPRDAALISYCRRPDGTGTFTRCERASFGEANTASN